MAYVQSAKKKLEKKFLRVDLWGESGTGKTVLALKFPNPVLFPIERGHIHYYKDFDFVEFVPENPNGWTFKEILTVIKSYKDPANRPIVEGTGKPAETIIIDSISKILAGVQGILYSEQVAKVKKSTTRKNKDDIAHKDWGNMQGKYEELMNALDELDMNVVVIGRAKVLSEEDKNTVNVIQFCSASTEYIFDIVAQISHLTGNKRSIKFYKDRTRHYHRHQEVTNPDYENIFEPIFKDLQKGGLGFVEDNGGLVAGEKQEPTPPPKKPVAKKPPKKTIPKSKPEPKPPEPAKNPTSEKIGKADTEADEQIEKEGYHKATVVVDGKEFKDIWIPETSEKKGAFLFGVIANKEHFLHTWLKDKLKGRDFQSLDKDEVEFAWDAMIRENKIEIIK